MVGPEPQLLDTDPLVARVHDLHREISSLQRQLLAALAELDTRGAWEDDGAHDMAHWTAMQLGVTYWKAARWVDAGQALPDLPATAGALDRAVLGIDKVVELTRLATPEDEDALVPWASEVAPGAIRAAAELASSRRPETVAADDEDRSVRWRYVEEGRRFSLEAHLPAAQGAVVAKALERLADAVPVMPGEGSPPLADLRRADALVALCSARLASDPDPDRATIVVNAQLETLLDGNADAQIEGGPVIDAASVQRLLCNARVQTVIEDGGGSVLGLGRMSREPSTWMMRQLRHRDARCRFPGCAARRFTHAHHIDWWSKGGRTDLDNLILICSFHHRLVHELRWRVERYPNGDVGWYRPNGDRYRAGPRAPNLAA